MAADNITISIKDGDFKAYVARPVARKAPAVIVIQEIFGVNEVVRLAADRLAVEGYLAIAPDLFWRLEPGVDITDRTPAEWDRAFAFMNAFDTDMGVADIQATIDGHVGAVGYCLGGRLAFLTATRTDVDAAVGYYGVTIDQYLGEADKLTRPLVLHIAEEDEFVPKDAQARIIAGLKNRPLVEVFTYPGRDHAFAREGGAHFDAQDAAKANARTLEAFRKALV
jgi:carboxymethylenebutenolidase